MSMFGGALLQGLGAGIGTIGNASMQQAVEQNRAAQRRMERAEDFEREKQMMLARIAASEESDARRRKAEAEFSDSREPVRLAQAAAAAKAGAATQDTIDLSRLNNQPLVDARTAAADREAAAATNRTLAGQKTMLGDTELQRLAREKAAGDAEAATTAEMAGAKRKAGDKDYLASVTAVTLADPRVAAQIAASRASAASAGASAEQSRAQTEGIRLGNADKKRLGELYDGLTSTLYDDKLSDADRAKAMQRINTQIGAIKAKNGQGAQRDPELDTVTTKRTSTDKDGNVTEVSEKSVRRPGQGGKEDKPSAPAVGTEVNGFVFQGGNPNDQKSWKPKGEPAKPARASMMAPQPGPPDSPEATSLDAARSDMKAAQATLQKYGSAQKQRDPDGYAAALQAVEAAKEALRKAEAEYQRTTGGGAAPGIRYPAP